MKVPLTIENTQINLGFCRNYILLYLCANQANGENPIETTPRELSHFRVEKRSGGSVARPLLAFVHPLNKPATALFWEPASRIGLDFF